MDAQGIKISVIATSRNDDHGANLRRRMQTFVNAFINQCKRHDLRSELILVEWNPPADRPRLPQALSWPADPYPCDVRIIEVPEHLHRRLQHSTALPLFQMIGKNVGIRRARGEYILVTNIDIIFNDETMHFLKTGKLEKGKIYRIDRTDVETDVPVDASIEEQLAYCQTHHVRINSVCGTFPVDSEGRRVVAADDVATAESGIVPGEGVSHVERDAEGRVFRWAGGDVVMVVTAPADRPRRLLMELSPGPCVRSLPVEIEVFEGKQTVARGKILGRSVVSLALPLRPGESKRFVMRAVEGGFFPAPPPDCRVLDVAIHSLRWSVQGVESASRDPESAFQLVASELNDKGDVLSPASGIRLDLGWHGLQKRAKSRYRWADSGASLFLPRRTRSGLKLCIWVGAGPSYQPGHATTLQLRDEHGSVLGEASLRPMPHRVRFAIPATERIGQRVSLHVLVDGVLLPGGQAVQAFRLFSCSWSDASASEHLASAVRASIASLALRGRQAREGVDSCLRLFGWNGEDKSQSAKQYTLPRVHTNACGDFMLMARENWYELNAYTELEVFSLHLDSLFMYTTHVAGLEEVVLFDNMRAYHIEHSAGSGWTPEGESRLFERLRAKGIPCLSVDELYEMVHTMTVQGNARLYSTPDWGLVHESLPETLISKSRGSVAA
jgi:hypothetical protein